MDNMDKYARIMSLQEIEEIREDLGKIVVTSGGFDPIHPGHTSCIVESKQYGDTLIVIVNGDDFLTRKKGKPFMDLKTRCRIVASIREVDIVVPFEIEKDSTVCVALQQIKPHVFTKGGDRTDLNNIPEWSICRDLNIEIVPRVGLTKDWSSSDLLADWGAFYSSKKV